MNVLETISKIGIIPVIALDDAKDAVPLAKALMEGGLPAAEITFRTAAAEECIKLISKEFPEMLVGAGTVLTTEQADRAINAGAKFIVSPGLNPEVVKHCVAKSYPILPGCANPSDIELALSLGLETVKFFPAEAAGGIKMIKAMSAPYGNVKFMPTGGITSVNVNEYLGFNKIIACGGSWMVTKELIAKGDFSEIARLTREAVETMLGFKLMHIGINEENEEKAMKTAGFFESVFGFSNKDNNASIFAGSFIEVLKSKFLGKNGHIAIGTNSVERAVWHLENRGVKFNESTRKYNDKGELLSIYLEEEISGFAVHLVKIN